MAEPIIVIKDGSSCTVYVLDADGNELGEVYYPDGNEPRGNQQARGGKKDSYKGKGKKDYGECYVVTFS